MSISKPLTFGELNTGDKFIGFPLDGDDSGHGGYRGRHWIFEKISIKVQHIHDNNAKRLTDGNESHLPSGMNVLQVE